MRKWWGDRSRRARAWLAVGGVALSIGLSCLLWWVISESWRRGAYPVVTEFVVPFFVGLAGTAVAVAAFVTSRRATDIAARALDAEHERARADERGALVRRGRGWLDARWVSAIGWGISVEQKARQGEAAGDTYVALAFDLDVIDGTGPLKLLLTEAHEWMHRVQVSAEDDFTVLKDPWGDESMKPEVAKAFGDFVRDSRIAQSIVEDALAAWARDEGSGSATIEETVRRIRTWNT